MVFEQDLGKVGMTTAGAWNAATSYERLTLVTLNGSSYISLINNKGVTPGTNTNVWQLVAQKGADGSGSGSGSGGGSGSGSSGGDTIGVAYYSDGYLYWTKNGEWLLDPSGNMVRAQGIDGKDGTSSGGSDTGVAAGAFKSIVFTRSNTRPDTPTGGDFDKPVPAGWYDGIPSGESILWMSTRWFYKDESLTSYTKWSVPSQATDTASVDFEYSSIISPGNPTSNPAFWHNAGTVNDIWMAIRTKKNGEWGDWTVAKIKGENGKDGKDGKDGQGLSIKGSKTSSTELPAEGNTVGDAYLISGNIWVWDGDSWADCGQFKGDPGESSYVHVAYSNDGGETLTVNAAGEADGTVTGKYIGVFVSSSKTRSLTASDYTWTKFEGEDGFGYEYIYRLTADYTAPDVPESSNEDEYVPIGWSDNPQDVTESMPYCWMCSRVKKNSIWGDYQGSKATGKASLFAKYGRDGKNGKDGVSPNTSFKSIIFKRSNTEPAKPGEEQGSFEAPIADGWSDGVPAGEEILWMSTRIFSSDGAAPQQTEWSTPTQVSDNEYMDYEYSSAEEPGVPSKDTPSGAEHNASWSNTADTATIWMAMRVISNGEYAAGSEWKVLRVKGEKGEDGTSLNIKGTKTSSSELPNDGTNKAGDAYLINAEMWIWDGDSWENCGTVRGPAGQNGQTPYIHIKYSNDGGKTFTANNGETPGNYIGIYWDYAAADAASVDSYKPWKKWKGEDGFGYEYIFALTADNTAPAVPTTTSQSDDYIPSGWADTPGDVTEDKPYCWVCYRKKTDGVWGAFVGSKTNSGKAALYSHYGKDGVGRGISEVIEMYAVNNDATTAPTKGWSTIVPDLSATNRYLWNYEIINYTDGDSIVTPESVIGTYGSGRGIESITEYYLISAKSVDVVIGTYGWSESVLVPTTTKPFLWNYEVIKYDDGTSEFGEPRVIGHYGKDGADGNPGTSISKVTEMYLVSANNSGIKTTTTGWSKNIPTITKDLPYLWNYEIISYDDGTSQTTDPCIIGHYGKDGEKGRGIKKITEHYVASASATSSGITETWSDTPTDQLISVDKPYLWNYETIEYDDGTSQSTTPVIIGVFGLSSQNDLAFLNEVFGSANVDSKAGAIVRTIVGVENSNKAVVTMINASDIGRDTTHGRLFIAAGMNGVSTASGIAAAKFKVYEDGTCKVKDLVATNADISGKITATGGTIGPFTIDEYTSMTSKFVSGNVNGRLDLCGGYLRYYTTNTEEGTSFDICVGLKNTTQTGAIEISIEGSSVMYGLVISGSSIPRGRCNGILLRNGANLEVGEATGIFLDSRAYIDMEHGSIQGFHLPMIDSTYNASREIFSSETGSTFTFTTSGGTITLESPGTYVEYDLILAFSSDSYSTLSLSGHTFKVVMNGEVKASPNSVKLYGGHRYHVKYASGDLWYITA